jgi:hypothetical protein
MRAFSLVKHVAFFMAVSLCCMGICYAQQSRELTGKWNMVSVTPDGDQISWVLRINHENGNYAATVEGNDGTSPAKDFRLESGKIHLRTTYQDQDYDIDLNIEENRLVGTWSGNGDSGETKGTKAVGPTAS